MPIPPIPSYPMPRPAELPVAVAPWRPDPRRAVLLLHDVQRYFLAPFDPQCSPRRELVANSRRLRELARAHGVPVVYTAQPGSMTGEQRGLLRAFWGPGMDARESDRAVVDELAPDGADHVLTKWRYSAFHHTPLESIVRDAGRDQLLVCGVYAHLGCLLTACDAFSRDIETFLVADALADFDPVEHRRALEYAARSCAVPITTDAALAALGSPTSASPSGASTAAGTHSG